MDGSHESSHGAYTCWDSFSMLDRRFNILSASRKVLWTGLQFSVEQLIKDRKTSFKYFMY